jgi:uncharacterized protein (DUF1778 family)
MLKLIFLSAVFVSATMSQFLMSDAFEIAHKVFDNDEDIKRTMKDASDLIKGLVKGVADREIPDLDKCIKNGDSIVQVMGRSIEKMT